MIEEAGVVKTRTATEQQNAMLCCSFETRSLLI